MSWLTRLANIVRSNRVSRDLDREMEFHLAERAEELVTSGMTEGEAMREARRRFGNRTTQKEHARDADLLGWLESLVADVRYAARALRASPGFAFVAILSLALGIGANTAIFSLVDAVMLKALPVRAPEELVRLGHGDAQEPNASNPVWSNPLWEAIRDRQTAFSGVFAVGEEQFDLARGGEARRVMGNYVSGDFFSTLGIVPATGRLISRADDVRGCGAIAVLGHGFWQSEYGGDPAAVGRTLTLDGKPFEIVGVAGAGFFGIEVGRTVQVYTPLCSRAVLDGDQKALDGRSHWWLSIVGRPKPGLSTAQVTSQLAAIAPAVFAATLPPDWGAEHQKTYLTGTLNSEPVAQGMSQLREEYTTALRALMIVVGVVLLIACANVANLLLARATTRQRELAIRLAIGARRGRVVRQLLTESVLLSVLGAAAGLLFARWGSALVVRWLSGTRNPVWLDLSIDHRVLAFTIAVATATGLLFGLVPAWRATRVDPQSAMKSGGHGVTEGHSRFSIVKALVVGQIALSLVLVASAGLLLGSFGRLATLDPGFRRDGLLLVSADHAGAQLPEARKATLGRELIEALRAVPGVRSVSTANITPTSGSGWNNSLLIEGFTAKSEMDGVSWFNGVSEDFFSTMGTGLVAGRVFGPGDRANSPLVAVVNEAVVKKFFGGKNPIGRTYRTQLGDSITPPVEIVGVVRNAKYRDLREENEPIVYVPSEQAESWGTRVNLQLRADGDPTVITPGVKEAIARVHPAISLEVTTMRRQLDSTLRRERLLATLSGFFGGLALLLAVVGLYGTMAYSVARRRNEIGIRIALGARRPRVLRLVLGEVGRLVAMGLVLGTLASLAATRLVESFLFGVTRTDATTLGLSALLLATVACAAGALPAWRAARLDPMEALRTGE